MTGEGARLARGDTLLIASHNEGKVAEISALLTPYGVVTTSLAEAGLPAPPETEATFEGNALLKARAAAAAARLPCLADDSGIEIDALDGRPGVHTADWAETANGRDFGMAMAKTQALLAASGAGEPWMARFVCVLALAKPNGVEQTFRGTVDGRIVWPPRGEHGHGYDPIFAPTGWRETFAEVDGDAKNAVSHRMDAFRKFAASALPAPA